MKYISKISGGKGGDTKAPTQRSPVEDPNTLQSRATGRVLYALGEGPFEGIIGGYAEGAKNIFLNDTPLMNPDGTLNFQGVTWDYRTGTPDQSWIEGFPAVENTHSGDVGLPTEIKRSTPAVRSVNNVNANAVRIVVAVSSLVDQNVNTGDAKGTHVNLVLRVRRQGRPGWEAEYPVVIVGKTVSAYEEQWRLPLPGEGPWDIQVERHTADSDRSTLQNATTWSSFTEIIDHKLRYPNTPLLALTFNAETFGNSMPTVTSRWRTWIVRVPNNYDPVGRTYTGFWNGGWKLAYTSNPAYLFLALLTHRSGCNLPDSSVDMGAIYTCGVYCDQYVPSGRKNSSGSDIMEPRFEAHFVINTRQEAAQVVNALASSFRAMAYWAAGQVTVVQDAPRDPVLTVNATQTIGGFEFAGPAVRAIKSVALVSFLDAENLDKPDLEVYEDNELIRKYGWQPESITAFACKSRGQARRLGKWFIETGKLGDTLSYKSSIDHLHASPGDIIMMTEPSVVGVDLGGRIAGGDAGVVHLDRPVTIQAGKQYTLHVQMPDGTVGSRRIINGPGTATSFAMASRLPFDPYQEASWVIEVSDLRPRQFRVMAVSDDGDFEYSVACVPHDPSIYARVELGLNVKLPPVSRLPNPGVVQPPSNVRVDRQYVSTPNGFTTALQLAWDASPDPYVRGYVVRYRRNNGNFNTLDNIYGTTHTIYGETTGLFTFHVQAVNIANIESRPAILEINIPENSPITLIRPTGLEIEGQGNNHVFQGRDPVFVWRGTAISGAYDIGQEPAVGAGYLDAIFRDYEVRVYSFRNELIFTDHTPISRYPFTFDVNAQTKDGPHRAFKFEVLMRDRWGNYSLPAAIEVSNPAPPQVTGLEMLTGFESIHIKYDQPTDLDYAGTLVWMSPDQGFEPGPQNEAYDGPNRYVFLQSPANQPRYLRVAAYDSFGKTGLNVSPEFRVTPSGVIPVDLLPPAVPIGLSLTDEVLTAPDGTQTYLLKAAWTANTEGDFLRYGVEIAEEGGNFLHFETNIPAYEWPVQPGVRYRVRLSAYDKEFNNSTFSGEIEHIVAGDNDPPSTPAGLSVTATFRSLWLTWTAHPDPDFSHMEVWESSTNSRTDAALVARAAGTAFIREGLESGTQRFYWIRASDRSRNVSEFHPEALTGGVGGTTRRVEESDYQNLSITNAAIANGSIDDAKILNLDASKIKAGSILSGEVIISGTGQTLSSATQATGDPAAAINRGTTTILPGKITISGGTTLQNMLWSGDTTKIDGGNIGTGTVSADKLIVGLRGIELVAIVFTPVAEENRVTWTAGYVMYPGASTQSSREDIIAGSAVFAGQTLYIYWHIGSGLIKVSTDTNVVANPAFVVLGTYYGGSNLNMTYGRTVIDGNSIRSGSIGADRIQANSITAAQLSTQRLITANAQIGAGVINQANIAEATVLNAFITNLSADRISAGIINSQYIYIGPPDGGGHFLIETRLGYRQFAYYDSAGIQRVLIGRHGTSPNRLLDGLYVRDINGADILTANGLGVHIVGTDNIRGGAVTAARFEISHTLGMNSIAGGNIFITVNMTGNMGYHEANSSAVTQRIPQYQNVTVRVVLNGDPIDEFTMGGVGGSYTSAPVNILTAPQAGSPVTVQAQMLTGTGWQAFGGDPVPGRAVGLKCVISAIEYKK